MSSSPASTSQLARPEPGASTPPSRPRRPIRTERVVGVLLVLLLVVVVMANRWGELVVDGRPDLYLAPGRVLSESLHTWVTEPSLGSPNFDVGYLPVAAVLWLVEHLGASPSVAFRLGRLALYLGAALGARRFVRDVTGDRAKAPARLTAATLYVANPYVVVGAATLPVLLPYALLPWLLVAQRGAMRPQPWRRRAAWVGAFVLLFAAMAGINAGVVPLFLLLAVPVVLADAVLRERVRLRSAVSGVLGCLAGAAVVSAYWLVASVSALSAGEAVAASSERPDAIAAVSSFTEVLRGLGAWSVYGADAAGAFRPGFVAYLGNPLAIVASFALVALAFVGALVDRSRVRALGVALLAVGAVVMVGMYPPDSPSPFGRVLGWAFAHVPGAVAFRTTSKAGAVALLGQVLLAALAVDVLVPRLRDTLARAAAAAAAIAVTAAAVWPAVAGGLYPGALPIPAYWRAAAADLDGRAATGRVWFVPGETNAMYRWHPRAVDDLGSPLLDRSSFIRVTVPDAPPEATGALAAADAALQAGTSAPGALSAWARYFGATDLLVRNDTVWEAVGGARPALVVQQVGADRGLVASALYGTPGQYTTTDDPLASTDALSTAVEARLPPLARYTVVDPQGLVRTYPATGQTLVVGDASAVDGLVRYSLLDGTQEFRLLGGATPQQARSELSGATRVVLTDTNRRRSANERRLDVSGALAGVADTLGPTRALYTTTDQTVAVVDGVSRVTASAYGSVFGPVPYGAPALAVDGDPATSWKVGDFGTAVGNWLRIDLEGARPVPSVEVVPLASTPTRLTRVDVAVGGLHRTADVSQGAATVTFPAGTTASSVTLTVEGTVGDGINPVGIAEVEIPGVHAHDTARLPLTLERLGLDASALAGKPLDVLLTRAVAGEGEASIDRRFLLPVTRRYEVQARVSVAELGDDALDRLDGVAPVVSLLSSDAGYVSSSHPPRALALHRPSQAFDGDPTTTWVPVGRSLGEWVQATFARRRVPEVTVRLARDASGHSGVASVRVLVDGVDLGVHRVDDGIARVRVPGGHAARVRVQITELTGRGPVAVSEVDLGGPAPARPDVLPRPCTVVATVDGRPLGVRLTGRAADLLLPGGAAAVGCRPTTLLTAGSHHLVATGPLTLESLYLADTGGSTSGSTSGTNGPQVTVTGGDATQLSVDVPATARPFDLMLAESYDRRWRAVVDGTDLGPPQHVDGYAMGWRLPAGAERHVVLEYRPQRLFVVALLLSGLALLAAAAAAATGVVRRVRRTAGRGGVR